MQIANFISFVLLTTVSKINNDFKPLYDMSLKYSLSLNPATSFSMIFASKNQKHVVDRTPEILENCGLMLDRELKCKKINELYGHCLCQNQKIG